MSTKKKQAKASTEKSIAEIAAEKEAQGQQLSAELSPSSESETAPAPETKAEPKTKAPGKIAQILEHFKAGKKNKEIAALPVLDENNNPIPTGEKDKDGNDVYETFHPTTISIQVSKYKKANPDIYPPQPPALTKAEKAAKAKEEKESAEKLAAANAEVAPVGEVNA